MRTEDSDALLALTPQQALAEGLATHVQAWALGLGAPADAARAAASAARAVSLATAEGHVCVRLDALGTSRDTLLASRVVAQGAEGGVLPLALDAQGRLYLRRHFEQERRLARRLLAATRSGLLSLITGGPGTGKTTRIAGLLAEALRERPGLRIALAAPTGKAATRMTEALDKRAQALAPELAALLRRDASTVHRLLGFRPGSGFARDAANPLPIDLLVVDEASMLDLALATRLLEAVPPAARVILLGDKDQLAAVESGAVFADLCADDEFLPVQRLVESWRFPAQSGIGQLAALVREGRAEDALALLRAGRDPLLRWKEGGDPVELAWDGHRAFLEAVRRDPHDARAAWAAFAGFGALCAVREGPRGVEALNLALSRRARQFMGAPSGATWYPGRPVMVLVNDYAMRLFNGDVGITLPNEQGELCAWFPAGGELREVQLARVPRHESAYAMTVHKAQGSEFKDVLVTLAQADSRVATRELVYTGVTRALESATVCGDAQAFAAAVARQVLRDGGVRTRLQEAAGAGGA